MKLLNLHLENILSHTENSFEFAPLTVFRGHNGAGKSTLVASVETMLAALCDYTDGRGAGVQSLLRSGHDKGYIAGDIEHGGEVRTLRCAITEKSGRMTTCKKEDDAGYTGTDYLAALALRRDVLACLVNGKHFFAKDEKEQKKLLASIILPKSAEFEPWVWPAVEQCGLQVNRTLEAFDLILSAYDAAYKERTAINRLIKEWRETAKPEAQTMSVDDIRARLKERQDARTAAAVKRGKLTEKWIAAGHARDKAQQKLQAAEVKLSTEQSRRAEVETNLLSKAKHKEQQNIAKCAEEAKKLDADITRIAEELRGVRQALAKMNDLSEGGKCPTCTQAITDEAFGTICAPLIARQDELLKDQQRTLDSRACLGDYQQAEKDLAAHNQAERDLKMIDGRIADLEKEIADLKSESGHETAEPNTSAIDAEIADLDARIERGNTALQAAIADDTLRKQYDAAMEQKKQLDAKRDTLERLVEYFGPKGVQAKLLGESVGPFQQKMNRVLAGWGFECRLEFEPYSFGVALAGSGTFLPLRTLSASQRQMFAVAFQVALAKVTGLNFVWVDAADIFLDDNRSKLYRSLMGSGLDQIVVLQSDTRTEIPQAPNAAFYMLRLENEGGLPTCRVEKLG